MDIIEGSISIELDTKFIDDIYINILITWSEFVLFLIRAEVYCLHFDLFSLSISECEHVILFIGLVGDLREDDIELYSLDLADCVDHHASWPSGNEGKIDGGGEFDC